MSADIDPLWKRIWKTEGIRWLGPRGDGNADAMERFQHGFECGFAACEDLVRQCVDKIRDQNEMLDVERTAEQLADLEAKRQELLAWSRRVLKQEGGAK